MREKAARASDDGYEEGEAIPVPLPHASNTPHGRGLHTCPMGGTVAWMFASCTASPYLRVSHSSAHAMAFTFSQNTCLLPVEEGQQKSLESNVEFIQDGNK